MPACVFHVCDGPSVRLPSCELTRAFLTRRKPARASWRAEAAAAEKKATEAAAAVEASRAMTEDVIKILVTTRFRGSIPHLLCGSAAHVTRSAPLTSRVRRSHHGS